MIAATVDTQSVIGIQAKVRRVYICEFSHQNPIKKHAATVDTQGVIGIHIFEFSHRNPSKGKWCFKPKVE
ncbi:hypothetical protein HanXRQr2_Chr09g0364521 [Helianthus annuus]|uniref:Uncharacterized protein n=1 Tax=Helianthus annuus TaxID=4232 RepID=A0A251TS78_HELAN|nr:hypothetical protein HanXRQr2_Chr09g0364521 [Helianthus annuus]KAJ0891268.1 hypothetical protein HanPSC8_Chr09g0351711 [Helianthus annuus]